MSEYQKPKIATIFEIVYDLNLTVQQLEHEVCKFSPDMKVIKKLVSNVSIKTIAVNGLLNTKAVAKEDE